MSPRPAQDLEPSPDVRSLSPVSLWTSFLTRMMFNYEAAPGMPVVDRLSNQEETEMDRYLAAGVDIDDDCLSDGTFFLPPLLMAISKNCLPLVNALIDRGARVSMQTIGRPGPVASSSPWLKRSALTWSMIFGAHANPHAQAITSALLAVPATLSPEEINAQDHYQRTPLMVSVTTRNTMVRDILVASGADVAARDQDGRTMLHLLAFNQAAKVDGLEEEGEWLNWMIDQGVPTDAVDVNNQTALDLARQSRSDDGFTALLERVILDRKTPLVHGSRPARTRRL